MAPVEVSHTQILSISLQDKPVVVRQPVEDVPDNDREYVKEQQVEETKPDPWVFHYNEVPIVQAFECKSFVVVYNVTNA